MTKITIIYSAVDYGVGSSNMDITISNIYNSTQSLQLGEEFCIAGSVFFIYENRLSYFNPENPRNNGYILDSVNISSIKMNSRCNIMIFYEVY